MTNWKTSPLRAGYSRIRTAFTLVEMLIAMALTLILVYAIAEFYAYIGNAVRDGRATIEMGGQLRSAAQQLSDDLQMLTLRPTPWIDPNISPGYFTVYEGPGYDADPDFNGITANTDLAIDTDNDKVPDLIKNGNTTTLFGDGDDILAFTIRAKDIPFQGRFNGAVITSQYAEVIWFTSFVDTNNNATWDIGEYRFLCRKLLLIRPDLGAMGKYEDFDDIFDFYETNDISMRVTQVEDPPMSGDNDYVPVANSIAGLARRDNRFGCGLVANAPRNQGSIPTFRAFPNYIDIDPNNAHSVTCYTLQGAGFGEDRVLTNVLAFDVKVWDPEARIYLANTANGTVAVTAGDPGYVNVATRETPDPLQANAYPAPVPPPQLTVPLDKLTTVAPTVESVGAWVDLNYNQGLNREPGTKKIAYTHFSGQRPSPPASYVVPNLGYSAWDTWPTTYETAGTGNGVNGLDDDGVNGVDDPAEHQTQPPYPFQLRGIQVRIRIYEPQTRQMRQATVGAEFVAD